MVLHFVPDYVGPFRYRDGSYGYETESKEFMFPVAESENHVLPTFLEGDIEQQYQAGRNPN